MTKAIYIILILLFADICVANSQVSGKILFDSLPAPGAEISLKQTSTIVMSNFDGEFMLPTKSDIKKDTLIITFLELIVEIRNIDINTNGLDLGEIQMPYFKCLSIEKYEQLSELEKENCIATYHWASLNGYIDTSRLDSDYLTLSCNEQISDFHYNPKTFTMMIDWDSIKNCIQKE